MLLIHCCLLGSLEELTLTAKSCTKTCFPAAHAGLEAAGRAGFLQCCPKAVRWVRVQHSCETECKQVSISRKKCSWRTWRCQPEPLAAQESMENRWSESNGVHAFSAVLISSKDLSHKGHGDTGEMLGNTFLKKSVSPGLISFYLKG